MENKENKYELIKFEDGEFSLNVNVSPEEVTVWLTQNDMAYLFDIDRTRITRHIKNIFEELELDEKSNVRKTHFPFSDKNVNIYNLEVVIAVGYRVKSKRGIVFRRWATQVLKQYLLQGYSINDKRCLDYKENIISLNNKVSNLIDNASLVNTRLNQLVFNN